MLKFLLAVIMLLALAVPVVAVDKVSLCHATGSASNPYVFITIATPADRNAHVIDENGALHGDKLGNQDFYADSEEECKLPSTVTPAPTTSASASPEPTAVPSTTPTPSVTPSMPVMMPDTAMESPRGIVVTTNREE